MSTLSKYTPDMMTSIISNRPDDNPINPLNNTPTLQTRNQNPIDTLENSNISNSSLNHITNDPNIKNVINSYKMQIMKKDKTIFNYSKIVNDSRIQIDKLQKIISTKDSEISNLKIMNNELIKKLELNDSKNAYQTNKFEEYKKFMQNEIENANINANNHIEKYDELLLKINDNEKKMKNFISENNILKTEIENKNKNLYELNQNIKDNLLLIGNLKNENNKMNEIYSKNITYEKQIESYQNEIDMSNDLIMKLKNENEMLNNRLIKSKGNANEKEIEYNNNIFMLQTENNNLMNNSKIQNEENLSLKETIAKINKDNENLTSFITSKTNELNELIYNIINCKYNYDLMNELNNISINTNSNSNFNNTNQNITTSNNDDSSNIDIKFEIINDTFNKCRKKLLEYSKLQKDMQNKIIKQCDNANKESENLYSEINNLKEINTKITKENEQYINKLSEQTLEYNKLNEEYAKINTNYNQLFSKYQNFSEKSEQYLNDNFNYITKLIGKFENLDYLDKVNYNFGNKNPNEVLLNLINNIISKYKNICDEIKDVRDANQKYMDNKNKFENEYKEKVKILENKLEEKNKEFLNEVEKQKKITFEKVKKITDILDESKLIVKKYENDIRNLSNENERLNYRYKMLLTSSRSFGIQDDII